MSSSSYREIWKRLYDTTQSYLTSVKSKVHRSVDSTPPARTEAPNQESFPPLDLNVPADFLDPLHGLGLPQHTLQSAISKVQLAIDEQKALHQTKYQEVCAKLSRLNEPSTSYQHRTYYTGVKKSHEISFQRQVVRIQETLLKVYENVHFKSAQSNKPVFNAEYTPVLEQYFEYNAFPSARDRELLARKSSMLPRQIEVWFQNHRRRARLEGRALRRISDDPLPAQLSLRTLKEQMPDFMMHKKERSPSVDEEDAPTSFINRLPSPAPTATGDVEAHGISLHDLSARSSACPPKYSPRDWASLLSNPPRPTFEAPVWFRKASCSSSARSSPSPSIEELCSDIITKLHIGGAGSIRKQRDPRSLERSVATRRRFALETPPADASSPGVRSTARISGISSDDVPIAFGSTSLLRGIKRHQPYDRSRRRYPNWSLDKSESRPCTPPPSFREKRHIPRRPSVSSSSGSSLCSDPPTPRDSPNCFAIQPLPCDSPDTLCDPYAFDLSADILITSSYPSSTERYAPYRKPTRLSSRASSPSYPRFSAY